MAVAQPFPIDRSELDLAVDKIRAGQPLTGRERALVNQRGEELWALESTDEPPPQGVEPVEVDPEDEEDFFEMLVEADADKRQGVRGTPWREYFADRGIPVPPARTG